MSTDPAQAAHDRSTSRPADQAHGQSADEAHQPSEAELRAAYEAEMSRISSADMILQAAVSLLNIGGYRLGLSAGPAQPTGGARDLEQVRDAIDGARALLPILERTQPNEMRPLRDALSQLQMAYAREARASSPEARASAPEDPATAPATSASKPGTPAEHDKPGGPGPAESSGRLWVPGR